LTAGGTYLFARGIGVTASGVLMFSRGPGTSVIGQPPASPEDPFEITYARGFVLGISYNFK
jgi:hypothetical protein